MSDTIPDNSTSRWRFLTMLALIFALAIVIARMLMLETIREPFEVAIGETPPPRSAGAGTIVVLNLLTLLPAMLVALRGLIDRQFKIRRSISIILFLLLGALAVISRRWAGDQFNSILSSSTLFAAGVVCWTVCQCVRDWAEARIVGAVCAGLLGVLITQGLYYRLVELPDLRESFVKNEDEFYKQRGWDRDSFTARQFKLKVMNGELTGFTASPNTYAAEVTMTLLIVTALGIQRYRDRDPIQWWIWKLLFLAFGVLMVFWAGSRGGAGTLALGIGLLAVIALAGGFISHHRTKLFGVVLAGIFLLFAAIILHGIHHGTLFHDSLTFRWRYWVASWDMFTKHLWLGVGWGDFGLNYLASRLPIAAEEIKDPHNFIVRTFVELGFTGLVILVLWQLRLWWEISAPARETSPMHTTATIGFWSQAIGLIALIGFGGIFIQTLATIDGSMPAAYNLLELLKRCGYLCVFLLVAVVTCVNWRDLKTIDTRPAPLLLSGFTVAIGMFFVHNLIDFSMFENGPMFLFAAVLGTNIAMRRGKEIGSGRLSSSLAVIILIALTLIAVVGLVAPTLQGESLAQEGDDFLRAQKFSQAGAKYAAALESVPFNSDYAIRSAKAFMHISDYPRSRHMMDRAIELTPNSASAWRLRSQLEENLNPSNIENAINDLKNAIRLNPNEVQFHIELAQLLQKAGKRDEARKELELALQFNDLLFHDERHDHDEPKRLSPEKLADVQKQIESLRK